MKIFLKYLIGLLIGVICIKALDMGNIVDDIKSAFQKTANDQSSEKDRRKSDDKGGTSNIANGNNNANNADGGSIEKAMNDGGVGKRGKEREWKNISGKHECSLLDSGGIDFKKITNDDGAAYCDALLSNFEFTPIGVKALRQIRDQYDAKNSTIKSEKYETFEALLYAISKEVDKKINKLELVRKSMSKVLAQYDQRRQKDIDKLVKMYENMRPKDAARIFMDLDMDVLLNVADRMRESQLAQIVALMDTGKAKVLTDAIAKRHIDIDDQSNGDGENAKGK